MSNLRFDRDRKGDWQTDVLGVPLAPMSFQICRQKRRRGIIFENAEVSFEIGRTEHENVKSARVDAKKSFDRIRCVLIRFD